MSGQLCGPAVLPPQKERAIAFEKDTG